MELFDFTGRRGDASGIVSAVEVGGDLETGASVRASDEVEEFLVAGERFGGPVFRDLGKQAVLDGIPLGGAGWIVSDSNLKLEGIAELRLKFGFPGIAAATIAAASVGQDQKASWAPITVRTLSLPPAGNRMSGEGRGVMRDADENGAAIGRQIIDAVGDGHASGIGAEIVVIDPGRENDPISSRCF